MASCEGLSCPPVVRFVSDARLTTGTRELIEAHLAVGCDRDGCRDDDEAADDAVCLTCERLADQVVEEVRRHNFLLRCGSVEPPHHGRGWERVVYKRVRRAHAALPGPFLLATCVSDALFEIRRLANERGVTPRLDFMSSLDRRGRIVDLDRLCPQNDEVSSTTPGN